MELLFLPHALRFSLIVLIALFCKVNPACSQASNIVPDNTLGDESSQVIENAEGQPNEVITGGAVREQNLFHSFQEFNVSEGRGAFFANPEAVSNIFSRVTGSNPSNILGTLGVNGAANLYLINPNGIVFGANSSLDVQGSFTATTGSGIRFGEQGEFNTIDPQAPQALTIDPSAYLFNQIANQDINSIESQGDLRVSQGENIVLLGGDLSLKGILVALGGTIELGSINDTGEIGISEESNLIFSDGIARGNISLSKRSGVNVSTIGLDGEGFINVAEDGEGFINVYSQNLSLTERSQMIAGIFPGLGNFDTVGGDIFIDVLGTVSLDDSSISNTIGENAEGNAGDITIITNSLEATNGGQIIGDIEGTGNTGDITITATNSVILDGENNDGDSSRISSIVFPIGRGNLGDLEINTGSLNIVNGSAITRVLANIGEAGETLINADFVLLEDSGITTRSDSVGNGAGDITLNAFNTLVLENAFIDSQSRFNAGGEIRIVGEDIRLRGDSDITSQVTGIAFGIGNIGDNGGNITITADSVIAFDDSDIFAFAQDGTGGNITLNTPVFFGENFTSNSLTDNPDLLRDNSRADLNATGEVSAGNIVVPDVSFIQNSLSELPDNSLNTDELLANSCVVPVGNREQGQFIITGGESLPARPGDSKPSKYPTGEVRNLPGDDISWRKGDRIVEPQGAYRLANGKLVLSRECQ